VEARFLSPVSFPPPDLETVFLSRRCKAHGAAGLIAGGHRNHELFYALHCRSICVARLD